MCQSDANKYLENVTALWMVERIRHRDVTGNRYDLKFTIVPIYNEQQHQLDHNILEDRLRSQTKRTFILRDSDYPKFFQANDNRRMDLFSSSFERSLTNFMSPNNLMQKMFGLNLNSQKQQKIQSKDSRLNTGEFYMAPKVMNSPKPNFHPTVNNHAKPPFDHRVRFPDSREISLQKQTVNLFRPKPEIYNNQNIIDYRGANDNVFVGSNDHELTQRNHQAINVPLFSIPVEMGPLIQIAQTPYGLFPVQIQSSTPTNQVIFQQQPDVTTFRYHPQLIGLSNPQPPQQVFNPYLPVNFVPANRSNPFHESERHTMTYYSEPDPVYHTQQEQSTTEAPIHPSTYSPRFNYANLVRPQLETPISTASSSRVNTFDDNEEFQPVTPSYDVRKYNQFKNFVKGSTTTDKPDSSIEVKFGDDNFDTNVTVATSYITPTTIVDPTSDKANEVNYQIVMGRPKSSTFKFDEKPTEKSILKWIPKKQRNKLLSDLTSTTPLPSQFIPTLLPIETTTQQSTRLTTHIYRGRNRFNKRNSSSTSVRAATISPQITTKILRKKTSSATTISSTLPTPISTTSSVFPTYITPVHSTTDEPITSQSFSTSISLEVNGERVFDQTTTPGYELVSAGVESINTNNTNVKLFKASVVPEKFDDLTVSILNHANALRDSKDEN